MWQEIKTRFRALAIQFGCFNIYQTRFQTKVVYLKITTLRLQFIKFSFNTGYPFENKNSKKHQGGCNLYIALYKSIKAPTKWPKSSKE